MKNKIIEKLKNERKILESEVTCAEYIFWWICRVIMFSVLVDSLGSGGRNELQMKANTALLFVLPTLHILPRGHFTLARLSYRAQTIACAMVIITCCGGCYLGLYTKTWFYDAGVHFLGGAVCCAAGYYLTVAMLKTVDGLSPLCLSLCGFGLSCFTSLAWECYEFFFDWFANDDTQHWSEIPFSPFIAMFPTDPARYPLFDTMTDLAAGLAGAVVGAAALRLLLKRKSVYLPSE